MQSKTVSNFYEMLVDDLLNHNFLFLLFRVSHFHMHYNNIDAPRARQK